jgi:hypothetical protein
MSEFHNKNLTHEFLKAIELGDSIREAEESPNFNLSPVLLRLVAPGPSNSRPPLLCSLLPTETSTGAIIP